MNRRDFVLSSVAAIGAASLPRPIVAATPAHPAPARMLVHRFGVNYVPSQRWYFCWNDWHPDEIAADFDRIAELGVDHLRIMLLWPSFQPNPRLVSAAHLDRLDELMRLAAARKLDVLVTLFTGWLSGFHFNPPFLEKEPFYTSPKWAAAQDLFLAETSTRLVQHQNFLGYDLGNEINCNWTSSPAEGDAWMRRIFARMRDLCPGRVHVNGVDHQPWFRSTAFSPAALVAEQEITTIHSWPFWTGAGKRGGPLDAPYTRLAGALAALARSLGGDPSKPIWLEEFGACTEEMPEADLPRWLEATVTSAVGEGVSWFTYWASHDVSRTLDFHPFEYGLGLIDSSNRIKPLGRVFADLVRQHRGQAVKIPTGALPPPPSAERTPDDTWRWLLDYMQVKPSSPHA